MALPAVRFEYRIALSHVPRGLQFEAPATLACHSSESMEHLTLRVLAWCLLHEEGITFGPGLCDGDGADLVTMDPTGRAKTWIECGGASWEKARRVLSQNSGVRFHALFASPRKKDDLLAEIVALPKPPKGDVTLWTAESRFVSALADRDARRQRWTVTVVDDHMYVDADGVSIDGEISSERAVEPRA
jgi:uncharacterized protein YaeQ